MHLVFRMRKDRASEQLFIPLQGDDEKNNKALTAALVWHVVFIGRGRAQSIKLNARLALRQAGCMPHL